MVYLTIPSLFWSIYCDEWCTMTWKIQGVYNGTPWSYRTLNDLENTGYIHWNALILSYSQWLGKYKVSTIKRSNFVVFSVTWKAQGVYTETPWFYPQWLGKYRVSTLIRPDFIVFSITWKIQGVYNGTPWFYRILSDLGNTRCLHWYALILSYSQWLGKYRVSTMERPDFIVFSMTWKIQGVYTETPWFYRILRKVRNRDMV
jgi:hypothetical protein